ncbi:MAG: AAA family ATPase [Lachnospirales bacterium]
MLKKYIIENYKSFVDKSTFDIEALDEYDLLEENIFLNVLKGILFVGPNASGKTNAISALITLMNLVFTENYEMSHNLNFFEPKDIFLSYEFLIEGSKKTNIVKYEITYNVDSESNVEILMINDGTIFEKEGKTIYLREFYENKTYGTSTTLINFFKFLENTVILDLYSNNQNKKFKGNYNPVTIFDDSKLQSINTFFEEHSFNMILIKRSETALIDELFIKRKNSKIEIPYEMESIGTKKLIYMLPIVMGFCNEKKGMMLLDEYGAGLHNELEELMLKFFMSKSKGSQIFACSHSTNLLKNSLFRPDQIYAIDINNEHNSCYEKFSDQSPRASQSLERMYLGGVFGGLPNFTGE